MELHGGLGGSERCPREHREAKIDGGRIQRIDGLVEVECERIVCIEPPRDAYQLLCEVGIDAPVAHRVGISQGVAGDRTAENEMVEFGRLRTQTQTLTQIIMP